MLRKIFTEPLLHFIVISILFFIAYDVLNSEASDDQVILVSEGRVAQISNSFMTRWNRAPLPAELERAIHGFAVEEMYLREARALNLDVGDKVINRRLRQKMNFLLEDMTSGNEPADEELERFFKENTQDYRSSPQYGFRQVFVSSDRGDEELRQLLLLQKQRIQQGLAPEGDRSLLPSEVSLESKEQLARKFGETFVSGLEGLELKQWLGPLKSEFGLHFVFLQTKQAANIKPFESVKKSVLNDWQYQNKQSYQEQYEQRLLERYNISVQMPESTKPE